ncbi:MAG: BamA/TamA family outer membrane protein [Puniceicoccales bacterium]|jgi:outer membrane protein insertion porin family|nr:BamA/TamA family outer membrane protein [Puniceicoccales bacterium]
MPSLIKPSIFALLVACSSGFPEGNAVAPVPPQAPASLHPPEPTTPPTPAPADKPATPPLAFGPIISEITYRFDGPRQLDPSSVAAHLKIKEGEPLTPETSDASVRALYATGLYEFVSLEPELNPVAGTVKVQVLLAPRLRIMKVSFEGNTEWEVENYFGTSLIEESLVQVGDPLDELKIKRTVQKLVKKYVEEGYPYIEITPRIERNDEAGTAVLTFVIKENLVIHIDKLTFVGNEHIDDTDLRPVMDTSTWSLWFDSADFPGNRFAKFSFLRRPLGYLNKETLHADLLKLRDFYRNQGFLDAEVPAESVEQKLLSVNDSKGELEVTIKISEGQRYIIGSVKIEGNTLGQKKTGETDDKLSPERRWEIQHFNTQAILAHLAQQRRDTTHPYPLGSRLIDIVSPGGAQANNIKEVRTNFESLSPNDWYAATAIDNAIEKIRDYYGQHGYLNTFVRVQRRYDFEAGKVDLVFHITEGLKTYLGAVNITGNTKTRNRIIARELLIEPGEVFDTVRMKNSEKTLRNTRFFDNVTLYPETTNANIPNQRDLRVEVVEARTGDVSFGVGFDSVQQIFGYAQYSESNFDIFNWRNYFRGGGQKFRLRVQIGTRSSSLVQSYDYPWVGGRELTMGYSAYLSTDSYSSSDYETERLGLDINARRRVFENVYASLNYNIEEVRNKNIAWNAPLFVRREEGTKLISKVGLTLSRDMRNDLFFPTYGNRFVLSQHVAGGPLGGDVNYYRIEAKAAQWIPIFDAAEQTLQLTARAGAMVHFGNSYIPFYEKFYLGGAYDMRGFKYKHVGPYDSGEPCGGNSYLYLSAEYTIKLFEQLRFAMFYDWGIVNPTGFDFKANNYHDNAGFGFRILVMGALMRIDVGFPLTASKAADDGVRFNFSFGANF